MFIDQKAGATIDVALVGDPADIKARALAIAPAGATVRFRAVANDWASLQTERARIRTAQLQGTAPAGIVMVRTNVRENVVEITVDPSRGDADTVAQRFAIPGVVEVMQGAGPVSAACTGPVNCGQKPWRGGLAIRERTSNDSDGYCSTGFVIRAFNNLPGRWILTAGHCGPKFTDWEHPDALQTHLGITTAHVLAQGTRADSAAIDINDGWGGNMVMLGPGNPAPMRAITSVQGLNGDEPGDLTCHDGKTTVLEINHHICGDLIDDDADITPVDDGILRIEQRIVEVRVDKGDSGGAVFLFGQAIGTVTAASNPDLPFPNTNFYQRMYYSHIFHVVDLIGGPQNTVLVQTTP